jgi:hypothetical protein
LRDTGDETGEDLLMGNSDTVVLWTPTKQSRIEGGGGDGQLVRRRVDASLPPPCGVFCRRLVAQKFALVSGIRDGSLAEPPNVFERIRLTDKNQCSLLLDR